MATATTSIELGAIGRLYDRTRRAAGYRFPTPPRPKYVIAVQPGQSGIEDILVQPFVESLAGVEILLFGMLNQLHKKALSILEKPGNEVPSFSVRSGNYEGRKASEILQVLKDCGYDEAATTEAISQLRHTMSTHGLFDRAYLHDQARLALYKQSAAIMRLEPSNITIGPETRGLRVSIGQRSEHLCEHFLRAALSPLIGDEETTCFRRKWEVLSVLVAVRSREDREGRQLLKWYNITDRLPKRQHPAKEPTTAYSTVNGQRHIVAVLYLTSIAVIINICFFAIAYSYSPPEPGTSHDADFWLLWQGGLTQIFSLVVVGYGLWNEHSLPRWYWMAPIVMASVCSLGAIPMYIYLPVGWSALLTTISSTLQAFITLQLALMVKK